MVEPERFVDLGPLDEEPSESEMHLTLRERLTLHRERSDCRGCHEQIFGIVARLEVGAHLVDA